MKLNIDKNLYFCMKVHIVIYQASQIINLQVTFYFIKVRLLPICRITANCNFNNQLLYTTFCLSSVGWIKANGVSFIPILFCPLTVMAANAVRKKVVIIGHFSPSFCLQSLQIFLFVRSNQEQLYVLNKLKIRER